MASAQLTTPTLSSPNNNITGAYTRQTFSWNKVTNATGYTIQLDTVATFDSPHLREIAHTGSSSSTQSHNVYSMRYGATYYWRVRAYNSTEVSDWSTVRTLTTTDQVYLNSPNDNITGAYTRQQFYWNNSRGAKGYILELDTSEDFSSPHLRRFTTTVDSSSTSDYFSRIVYNMRYGTTYHWRVRSYNSADTSGWSEVRTLTTTDHVLLNSPNDNITGAYTRQQLYWNNSRGAKGYILELDTATDFSSPHLRRFTTTVDSSSTSDYFSRVVYSMRYGTTYYWRVRSYNSADTSGWSEVRTLTTTRKAFLNSPSDNASGQSATNLYLYWNNSFGSKGYIIELDTNTHFSSPQLQSVTVTKDSTNISTSFWYRSFSNMRYGTTYHWRVRAYNSADTSDWSDIWHFTTAYNITTGPTLTMPANDSTGVEFHAITLVWQAMDNVQGYHYEVSTHSTFDTIVAAGNTSLTFTAIHNAIPSTTYYWRVRGYNAQGNTQYSSVWHFTTGDVVLTAPVHAAPANGASMPISVDIAWHPVFGALTYDLQLSFDNTFTSAVSSFNTADTHYVISGLPASMNFYWRVRSNNGNDASEWSTPWTFNTGGCVTTTDTTYHDMCAGDSFEFFEVTYTSTGTYSHMLTNHLGCDSIAVLQLTVWPNNMNGSVTDTACNSYTWNDLTFTQSGNYPYYTTTVHECDSMVVLHLTLYNSVTETVYDTASSPYEWNGQQYTASGDYTQTFTSAQGCDSTVTLHLTVITVGIDNTDNQEARIYANQGVITIHLDSPQTASVRVYDIAGRVIASGTTDSKEISLPIPAEGVYMVKVGNMPAKKIVIVR